MFNKKLKNKASRNKKTFQNKNMTKYGINRCIYRCNGSRISDQNIILKTAICSKKQLAHMLGFECAKKIIKNTVKQTDIYIRARRRLLAHVYARMGAGVVAIDKKPLFTGVRI